MDLKYTLAWSCVTAWNSISTERFCVLIFLNTTSIKGIRRLRPGETTRLYLPKMVITPIKPWLMMTNDFNKRTIAKTIRISLKEMKSMYNIVFGTKVIRFAHRPLIVDEYPNKG